MQSMFADGVLITTHQHVCLAHTNKESKQYERKEKQNEKAFHLQFFHHFPPKKIGYVALEYGTCTIKIYYLA